MSEVGLMLTRGHVISEHQLVVFERQKRMELDLHSIDGV